jgi:hypothetical protein
MAGVEPRVKDASRADVNLFHIDISGAWAYRRGQSIRGRLREGSEHGSDAAAVRHTA